MTIDMDDIYLWKELGGKEGESTHAMTAATAISTQLLKKSQSIFQAYSNWREAPGVAKALAVFDPGCKSLSEYENTVNWAKKNFSADTIKIKIISGIDLEYEDLDVLCMSNGGYVPFVSEKVVSVLDKLCPSDFEKFPVSLETPFSEKQYYVVNITRLVDQDSLLVQGLGEAEIARLSHKSKSGFISTNRILYSGTIAETFKKEGITGLQSLKCFRNERGQLVAPSPWT